VTLYKTGGGSPPPPLPFPFPFPWAMTEVAKIAKAKIVIQTVNERVTEHITDHLIVVSPFGSRYNETGNAFRAREHVRPEASPVGEEVVCRLTLTGLFYRGQKSEIKGQLDSVA